MRSGERESAGAVSGARRGSIRTALGANERQGARAHARCRRCARQKGTGMIELAILLPLLLLVLLGSVDLGRLIYNTQVVSDLTREAANLASRGATYDEAFAATFRASGSLDLQNTGAVIISRVRRKSPTEPTAWIVEQQRDGALATHPSEVGSVNGPANIPNITTLPQGVTMIAVEIASPFTPIFTFPEFGLDFYPAVLYDVAYF